MAHEQDRPRVGEQLLLQQLQRLDVEVVRRLVEDEQVPRPQEELREQESRLLAAGERLHGRPRAVGGEEEVLEVAEDVARGPVHHDLVVALGDVLRDALLRVERSAELVEEDGLHARAERDAAGLRREPAEEEAQERRLARAVRAEHADALAAQDERVEVLDDRRGGAGPRERGALRLDDDLPRERAGADRELRRAGAGAALGDLRAELQERLHAAHVARAAGGDAVDDPVLLLPELHGLLLPGALLLREELVLAAQERRPVAVPAGEPAAVEVEDAPRDAAQERAVVRDEDAREPGAGEERLEPLDRLDVEVVRGLVEEQQVRLGRERGGELRAAALAAGERREGGVGRDAELREEAPRGGGPAGDLRGGAGLVGGDVLREIRRAEALGADDLAGVGLQDSGHDLEERALPFAVAAGDARSVARLDVEADVLEHGRPAEGDRHVAEGQQRHGRGV